MVSIVVNYSLGIIAEKYRDSKKWKTCYIWFTIVVNLGALIWYKYAFFFTGILNIPLGKLGFHLLPFTNQHLPLGISFFTFQAIAYVIDVYREQFQPQRNFTRFAMFMAFFPKLAAGPIIRYSEVAEDINNRSFNPEQFSSGIKRFVIGLGKKVLIADTLAKTTVQIFAI